MTAIEASNLTKVFRTYRKQEGFWGAVRGLFHREHTDTIAAAAVNFSIETGELVGFLGPNGAGKTTVLKMLAGLLHPTDGSARVLGFIPWERRNEYRRQFSLVMGQKNQLWWDLPARESFALNREIYGIQRPVFERRLAELTELLEVTEKLDVMVRELSLGERMKMELIAALLHSPRILLLDEPTIGLDVISQKKVREFVRDYNRRHQVTVLLTSHYMADIKELCERVIIMDHGRIFFDGRLAEIVNRFAGHKIIEIMGGNACGFEGIDALGEVLLKRDGLVRLKVPRARTATVCRELFARYPVEDINIEEVPIEDVIREIFGQEKREC